MMSKSNLLIILLLLPLLAAIFIPTFLLLTKNNFPQTKPLKIRKTTVVTPAPAKTVFSEVAAFTISQPNLVGIWQDSNILGSGWGVRYFFYEEGTYRWIRAEGVCDNGKKEEIGSWTLQDGTLKLEAKKTLTVDQLTEAGDFCDYSNAKEIWAASPTLIKRTFVLTLNNLSNQKEYQIRPSIKLNNTPYWRYSDDPYLYGNEEYPEPQI